jgi:hypothetical protein
MYELVPPEELRHHISSGPFWTTRFVETGRLGVEPYLNTQWTAAVNSLVSSLHEPDYAPPMSRSSSLALVTQES